MNPGTSHRPAGLTLVELLVSLAIGAFLSLAGSTLLLYTKRVFQQDLERARMQENGSYALALLSRELRMAGFLGTGTLSAAAVIRESGSPCFNLLLAQNGGLEHLDDVDARGSPAGGGDSLPPDCLASRGLQAGSDILLSRRVIDRPQRRNGNQLEVLESGPIYLLRPAAGGWPVLTRNPGAAAADGEVWRYQPQVFFVRDYSVQPGDGVPALCRKRLSPTRDAMAPTECLLEGVEDLQLEFGLDLDGDRRAETIDHAPGPRDLDRALVVRVFLLLRSTAELEDLPRVRQFHYAGVERLFDDRHTRVLLQTSVVLRNSPGWRP